MGGKAGVGAFTKTHTAGGSGTSGAASKAVTSSMTYGSGGGAHAAAQNSSSELLGQKTPYRGVDTPGGGFTASGYTGPVFDTDALGKSKFRYGGFSPEAQTERNKLFGYTNELRSQAAPELATTAYQKTGLDPVQTALAKAQLGNAATAGAENHQAILDALQRDNSNAGQGALITRLNSDLNGGQPSLAALQLQQGQAANARQALSMAAGARGGAGNQASALTAAIRAGAEGNQNLNAQEGMLRANEYAQARNELGNVLGQERGQTLQNRFSAIGALGQQQQNDLSASSTGFGQALHEGQFGAQQGQFETNLRAHEAASRAELEAAQRGLTLQGTLGYGAQANQVAGMDMDARMAYEKMVNDRDLQLQGLNFQKDQASTGNFWKTVGTIASVAAPIAGAVIGGPIGAAAGGALGGAINKGMSGGGDAGDGHTYNSENYGIKGGEIGGDVYDPNVESDVRAKKDIKPVDANAYLQSLVKDGAASDVRPVDTSAMGLPANAAPVVENGSGARFWQTKKGLVPVSADEVPAKLGAYVPSGPVSAGPQVDVRPARGFSYEYKDPNAPGATSGHQVGPMAQDLEKTPAGASTVVESPNGTKGIDTARLSLVNTAALSEQQRRIDGLETMLYGRGASRRPAFSYGGAR